MFLIESRPENGLLLRVEAAYAHVLHTCAVAMRSAGSKARHEPLGSTIPAPDDNSAAPLLVPPVCLPTALKALPGPRHPAHAAAPIPRAAPRAIIGRPWNPAPALA